MGENDPAPNPAPTEDQPNTRSDWPDEAEKKRIKELDKAALNARNPDGTLKT